MTEIKATRDPVVIRQVVREFLDSFGKPMGFDCYYRYRDYNPEFFQCVGDDVTDFWQIDLVAFFCREGFLGVAIMHGSIFYSWGVDSDELPRGAYPHAHRHEFYAVFDDETGGWDGMPVIASGPLAEQIAAYGRECYRIAPTLAEIEARSLKPVEEKVWIAADSVDAVEDGPTGWGV